jgi:hypothetical protein
MTLTVVRDRKVARGYQNEKEAGAAALGAKRERPANAGRSLST